MVLYFGWKLETGQTKFRKLLGCQSRLACNQLWVPVESSPDDRSHRTQPRCAASRLGERVTATRAGLPTVAQTAVRGWPPPVQPPPPTSFRPRWYFDGVRCTLGLSGMAEFGKSVWLIYGGEVWALAPWRLWWWRCAAAARPPHYRACRLLLLCFVRETLSPPTPRARRP